MACTPPPGYMIALVKRVMSGDTIVACPTRDHSQERSLSLAWLSTPRFGGFNPKNPWQPWGLEARETLRHALVGREVYFRIEYTITSTGRDFCTIKVRASDGTLINASSFLLEAGHARLRDFNRDGDASEIERLTSEYVTLRAIEDEARASKLGLCCEENKPENVTITPVDDARKYTRANRGRQLSAVIEQVCNSGNLQVRVLTSNTEHSLFYVSFAGLKVCCENDSTPMGSAARHFIERRLLQREVHIIPEYVDGTSVAVTVVHPAGSIAALLLQEGLARILDWGLAAMHSTKLADIYKSAETKARNARVNLWSCDVETIPSIIAAKLKDSFPEPVFTGTVTKIIAPDLLSIRSQSSKKEYRISFSSLRGPRKDGKKDVYNAAKEWLRSNLIGKTVNVAVDFVRPPQNEFEERVCATVTATREKKGKPTNYSVNEQLVFNGFASVVRHRREDENRASGYDALIEAEIAASATFRGIFSKKEAPASPNPPLREINNESEMKPKKVLPLLQKLKSAPAIIDHVFSASRFSIILPRDGWRFVMLLSGIRAPRPTEKWGKEALEKVCEVAYQRDAIVEVESADKSSSFIGTINVGAVNIALMLVENGYASIHYPSAQYLPFFTALCRAEESAKSAHLNIWENYNEQEEKEKKRVIEEARHTKGHVKIPKQLAYVLISEYVEPFKFFVQSVSDETVFEKFVAKFAEYHSSEGVEKTALTTARRGELVSAKFSQDERWYRARVQRLAEKNNVSVIYIDYGNTEVLPITSLRTLPAEFVEMAPKAQEAQLSFLRSQESTDDFAEDAMYRFRELTFGKRLLANLDKTSPLQITLFDVESAHRMEESPTGLALVTSINHQLLKDGCAKLDNRIVKRFDAEYVSPLCDAQTEARENRLCMWQYGDIVGDEDAKEF